MALPMHALLPLIAAVAAAATVILVYIKVYAPVFAATLAFRAATNLLISPPDAVLRAEHWEFLLHSLPNSLQSVAQATPGTEANAAPGRAPPIHLIALPLERVPVASPLASSSKELSVVCVAIGSLLPE